MVANMVFKHNLGFVMLSVLGIWDADIGNEPLQHVARIQQRR